MAAYALQQQWRFSLVKTYEARLSVRACCVSLLELVLLHKAGKNALPKEPTSQSLGTVTMLLNMVKGTLQRWLRILRCGNYPGLSGSMMWSQGKEGGRRLRDVTMEIEVRKRHRERQERQNLKMLHCSLRRWRKKPEAKGHSWKWQRDGFSWTAS